MWDQIHRLSKHSNDSLPRPGRYTRPLIQVLLAVLHVDVNEYVAEQFWGTYQFGAVLGEVRFTAGYCIPLGRKFLPNFAAVLKDLLTARQ